MRDFPQMAEQYIARVASGEEVVCRMRRLHIERHVRDVAASEGADFPFYFDAEAGAKFCRLFEMVKPSKWPTRMKMEPWLVTDMMILFGWKEKAEDTSLEDANGKPITRHLRRFRIAYCRWPRKTGKSAVGSVIGLYMERFDGEPGAEVYSAALIEEQARRVFDEAVAMVASTPELRSAGFVKVGDQPCRSLRVPESFSEFRPLSRDKESMEGKNIHCFIGDEIHKWVGRGAWDVLRYGMRSRKQPLGVGITTAPSADDTTSVCNSLDTYAEKVLTGVITDSRFFTSILEIDSEIKNAAGEVIQVADRWDDETKWVKACPNLGVTVKLEDMRQEALEASHDAEALNAFQRYSLNIRVGSLEQAIQVQDWDRCARPGGPVALRAESFERLKGRMCFAALDLALTDDTSSLVLTFPPMADTESWHLIPFFWIPGDNIEERVRKHQVPYNVWRDQGFLITTPGKVTDYDFIAGKLAELSKWFDLRELAYDPALASGLIKKLLDGGFKKEKVVKFQQTMMNYSAPCGDFIRAVSRRELAHDADPMLRWQISNLRWIRNHTGLFMPDKLKSVEKIDGVVASIMGYGRATHPDNAKLLKAKPRLTIL